MKSKDLTEELREIFRGWRDVKDCTSTRLNPRTLASYFEFTDRDSSDRFRVTIETLSGLAKWGIGEDLDDGELFTKEEIGNLLEKFAAIKDRDNNYNKRKIPSVPKQERIQMGNGTDRTEQYFPDEITQQGDLFI